MTTDPRRLSAADIARIAAVTPATVSNWRRRHSADFPASKLVDGREFFRVDDVAAWLDKRKVSRDDLRDGEVRGATYGTRFRRNFGLPPVSVTAAGAVSSQIVEEELARRFWNQAGRLRGGADLGEYSDLLLGWWYLRACWPELWAYLVRLSGAPGGEEALSAVVRRGIAAPLAGGGEEARLVAVPPSSVAEMMGGGRPLVSLIRMLDRFALTEISAIPGKSFGRFFGLLLERMASADAARGGEFFTPGSLADLMVALIDPEPNERLYDPCCGHGEILARAVNSLDRFELPGIPTVAGQALVERSWRYATMHLIACGVTPEFGEEASSALRRNIHAGQLFDAIVSNPPFNAPGSWVHASTSKDARWRYGEPSDKNSNFAWLQHAVAMLAPKGRATILMPNGASSTERPIDKAIRTGMVESGVIEGIIALPSQLFYSTTVSATLWLLRSPPEEGCSEQACDELFFLDASQLGTMIDRTHRILQPEEIDSISAAILGWREGAVVDVSETEKFYFRAVSRSDIRESGYQLNPRIYTAPPSRVNDFRATVEKLERVNRELQELRERAAATEALVNDRLAGVAQWKH